MIEFVNIADLKDPDDPQGRSFRQINTAKKHNIPLGSLVELEIGVRLFVVKHTRDCDQTPLYSLCADPDNTEQERKGFANHAWINGYSEEDLKVL